jgi:hypothetical protein
MEIRVVENKTAMSFPIAMLEAARTIHLDASSIITNQEEISNNTLLSLVPFHAG